LQDQGHLWQVGAFLRQETFAELASDSLLRKYDNQWHLAKTRAAIRVFTDPTVRNHWLHEIALDQLENYGSKNAGIILQLFYENCSDTSFLREIHETYSRDSILYHDHEMETYKSIGGFELDAHIFKPDNWKSGDKRAGIIFFHGGSWYQGTPEWLFESCRQYARLGLVAVAVEYRLYDRHGTSPLECIADAKSAIRWMRQNANRLGIDREKIVASGSSAGGHIALCAAMLNILDDPTEDLNISSAPNAFVLYYTCYDPTLDPWFVRQVESRFEPQFCSPNHNIRPGLPPSIVLHGTLDRNCPISTARLFYDEMVKAGNRCEFHPLEGAGHIFVMDPKYRGEAGKAARKFLISLGYIDPKLE
jgi:acetyl esterase/lipase